MMELLTDQQILIEENRKLYEEVLKLKATLETKENIEHHSNAYWIRKEDGSLDGPFSTQDWDIRQQLVRFADYGRNTRDGVAKVHFHISASNESIYVPLNFLSTNKVSAYR